MSNLVSVVDELAAVGQHELAGTPPVALQDELAALHTAIGQLQAQFARRLAALDALGAYGDERAMPTRAWLRHALRMSPHEASRQVRLARRCYGPAATTAPPPYSDADLSDSSSADLDPADQNAAALAGPLGPAPGDGAGLPGFGAAWAEGTISTGHVQVAAAATWPLPPVTVARMEPILLDAAKVVDPAELRRLAARAREYADPDGAAQADWERREGRWLTAAATYHGMVHIQGVLDPDGGATLLAALDALAAKTSAEDQRSSPQRRADALTELARRACQQDELPTSGGQRPHVTLIVDLPTVQTRPAEAPGEGHPYPAPELSCAPPQPPAATGAPLLPGLGGLLAQTGAHVGAPTARRICCDAVVHRVLRAGSEILDLGRTVRLVSDAQRRALLLRDRGCRFPGVRREALVDRVEVRDLRRCPVAAGR